MLRFEHSIQLERDREDVWNFLWDVPRLVQCIPGCRKAVPGEEPDQYLAAVSQKLGPFQVTFDIDLRIVEVEEFSRIVATAQGNDSKVASRMRVDLEVLLEENESGGVEVKIHSDVKFRGKLATLGSSVVRRKTEAMMNEFAASISDVLEGKEDLA